MKTIVHATDMSANSAPALRYAYEISKRADADLIVLNIFDIPTAWNTPTDPVLIADIEKEAIRKKVKALKDFCAAELDDDAESEFISYIAKENNSITGGIQLACDEKDADLLIVGTKGASTIREIFMGSTSRNLINDSETPVLCVPAECKYEEFKKILYATDLEDEDILALSKLSEITDLYDSRTYVIHIMNDKASTTFDQLKSFEEKFKAADINAYMVYSIDGIDNTYQYLSDYIKENKIDMVVMLEHEKRNFFERWFNPDLVKRMELHSSIPLLSFNQAFLKEKTEQLEESAPQTE